MDPQRYLPSPELKPFIRDLLFIESKAESLKLVLPDTSLVLAIRYKGSVSLTDDRTDHALPLATLSGLRNSPRHIKYSSNAANLLIRFEPGGAAAFFEEPLHQFLSESVPAADLKGYSNIQTIAPQLAEMTTNAQRAAFVQHFLRTQIKTPAPDPLLHAAIRSIQTSKGTVSIGSLAKQLYISQDAFEKRFRRSIGMSAKNFSSIIRLRHIIDSYSPAQTLTRLALASGYFDQAHFTHDFQRFTGQAPRRFFETASYW
jgi:AraC-like DNA-binding protein